MRIGRRLLLGYAAWGLFAALVAVVGFLAMRRIQETVEATEEDTLPTFAALSDIRFAGLEIRASTSELALLSAGTAQPLRVQQRQFAEIRLATTRYEKLMERLERLLQNPTDVRLTGEIRAAGGRLLLLSERVLSMSKRGATIDEYLEVDSLLEAAQHDFFRAVGDAVASVRKEAAGELAALRATMQRTKVVGVAVGVFAVALALFVGLSTMRSILGPLRSLEAAVAGIRSGRLSARAHVAAGDELGVLGESFDKMAEELERNVAERERRTEEKREAESVLLKSQRMLEDAQRTAHIGSWDRDLVTGDQVWSEELFRIFGQDPETFRPSRQAFLDGVHPEDRETVRSQIDSWIRTGVPSEIVFRFVRPDGDVRNLLAAGSVVFDGARNAVRILGTCQDVTAHRRLEDQLRQSQKMDAVGRLAGGIAHDFNNLLTVIQGYADLLRSDSATGPSEDRTEAIEQIRVASQRAAALTRQLLAFSRQQVLQTRVLELNAVVSNLAPMLRRMIGEDVTLVTNLDPKGGRVVADAGQLEQVLMNLVVNARDAMPQGGTLTVETGSLAAASLSDVEPQAPPGSYARLSVKDTGTGMSPQTKARIFEPFFTTKEHGKGTGLGLATVYGIVKQTGGFLHLDSEPGHGAAFHVYLPCTDEKLAQDRPISGVRNPIPHERVVLLIEDEEAVRKLILSVLIGHGYVVLEAHSGEEALAVAAGHDGPIHLVLSDVVMPGGGGPKFVSELQRTRPAAQVIFMSGYTDDSVVRHGVTEISTHFLQKPFAPETLLKKLGDVLEG